jgi:hypothetical protein
LLNLTLVVIGSCADVGLNKKSKEPTTRRINAEMRRRRDTERNGTPGRVARSQRPPVTVSLFLFILIGPTQPEG